MRSAPDNSRHAGTSLRVGFLIDRLDIGGTELNAIKVAETLRREGVSLTVFHLSESGPLRRRYEDAGAELIHVPIRSLKWDLMRVMRRIRQLSSERELSLLHTHCVYSNIIGVGAARLPGRRLPVLASRRWTGSLPKLSLGLVNRLAQSFAQGVLVNSPSLTSIVRRESPFSNPVYVPNLLPDDTFRVLTPSDKASRRIHFGLGTSGPIVGIVARLMPVKDHRTLFRAWEQVVAKIPSATLVVVGDGDLRPELENLATAPGVAGTIRFLGELGPEQLPHALFDVSVLSSLDEGFPNAILEAMAQGVPVVATKVGGVPDIVKDGFNGLLTRAGHAPSLAEGILQVLEGRLDVAALTAAGQSTAENHRAGLVVSNLKALYRRITATSTE